MTAPEIDIIVPVLGRPQNARPFMDSLVASEPGDVRVVAVTSPWDSATHHAWSALGRGALMCPARPGSFAQKVNAAHNALGAMVTGEQAPWLLLVGDDVQFHPGWHQTLRPLMADQRWSVIGTNDLGTDTVQAGEHATHMLIRRSYVDTVGASWDGPGVVCHEGYRHNYVDSEIIHAARQRGTWVGCRESVIEHMHPMFGRGRDDATYQIGRDSVDADRDLFVARYAEHVTEPTGRETP